MTLNTVTEQAANWMSQLGATDSPRWDDPDFLSWLDQSDAHREAFAEVSALWFAADQLDLTGDEGSVVPPPPRTRSWRWLAGAVAVMFVLAWLPGIGERRAASQAEYRTERGQTLAIELDDGSTLWMAGDTALNASAQGRGVELLFGEIFLDVAHNPNSPFVVESDRGNVTVLGTEFGVGLRQSLQTVGVVSGLVSVMDPDRGEVRLGPGQLLQAGQLDPRQDAALRAFGWRSGQLVFESVPMSQVLKQLEPFFSSTVIQLPGRGDPAITAVVAVQEVETLLGSLAERSGYRLASLGSVKILY